MPYARSLQQYCLPEFYVQPPPEWERRLREISPEMPDLDQLVFRWFERRDDWTDEAKARGGMWMLYAAKPIRLVTAERALDFGKHWSECATEAEQVAHRAIASSYQHFMWHARGLYVRPFLILQGPWGGTPARYTKQEAAFLQASGCDAEPFPIGLFPACPFDERVVQTITLRDRMLRCSNSYDRVAKLDTPSGIQAEQDAADRLRRETYLDTWKVMIQPQTDFMAHYLKRSEHRDQFPSMPAGLQQTIGSWKEHFLEHGHVLGATPARNRQIR